MPNINSIYDFAFEWDNLFNIQTVELYRDHTTYDRDTGETTTPALVDEIEASIQPLNESDLISLPEGDREREIFKIYTKFDDLQKDDIITYLSHDYKIKKPPQPWMVLSQLHHYKAFMYKVERE